MAEEILLKFPDFTKPFVIHTDASNYQLGGVISQDNHPIAYYSKKLNKHQLNYDITAKELLSIAEILKEYRHLLLGHHIIVKTDHKNLTHDSTLHVSQRVMRQRLIL